MMCAILVFWGLVGFGPGAFAQDLGYPIDPATPFEDGAPAGVIGPDNRVAVTSKKFPWAAIGKLVMDDSECTATLVGDDLILTNAHCAVRGNKYRNAEFMPMFRNGRKHFTSQVTWIDSGKPVTGTDFAIGRLRSPLGKRYGSMGTSSQTAEQLKQGPWQNKFSVAGYSGDFRNGQTPSAHIGCSVIGGDENNGLYHNCDTSNGASGSALFASFRNGVYILGLHYRRVEERGEVLANVAVPTSVFSHLITKYRANDKGKSEYTWVQMCNDTRHDAINTAFVYDGSDKGNGWVSRGWYRIAKGECLEMRFDRPHYNGNAYFYATGPNRTTWGGGPYKFCVSKNVFHYANSQKNCGEGYWAQFGNAVKVEYGSFNSYSFHN